MEGSGFPACKERRAVSREKQFVSHHPIEIWRWISPKRRLKLTSNRSSSEGLFTSCLLATTAASNSGD